MFFILLTVFIMMLSFILLFLGNFLSFKEKMDREKLSPFECGFTPKFSARLPFSLRFFMICIVFLLFDVELILLFPIVSTFMTSYSIFSYFILIITLMILFFGLLHEIFLGCLNWAN